MLGTVLPVPSHRGSQDSREVGDIQKSATSATPQVLPTLATGVGKRKSLLHVLLAMDSIPSQSEKAPETCMEMTRELGRQSPHVEPTMEGGNSPGIEQVM